MPAAQPNVNTKFSVLNDQGEFEDYSPDKLNSNVPTYFVAHGLRGTAAKGQPWQKDMVESIEAQNDGANVIRVSWDSPLKNPQFFSRSGPSVTNYEQAAANTQTVGQNLVDVIANSGGNIKPESTTLIGHSLGAQVSGWAGLKVQEQGLGKIDTIVGLDPARPSFQNRLFTQDPFFVNAQYKSPHRLVSSDADRVVAIHTSKRYGYTKPVSEADGNDNALDIYVNGGSAFNNREDIKGFKSHDYSHKFFQQLLDGEGFNQDRNKRNNSKSLGDLRNPRTELQADEPLVSLNTIFQGNGSPENINRGIVDIKRSDAIQSDITRTFDATNENDNIFGVKTIDRMFGYEGNDTLHGLGGDDQLNAGGGQDLLFGGDGADKMSGENDNDTLYGGVANDTLFGDNGNDSLYGDNGDDRLTGVNLLDARPGAGEIDSLFGGTGADRFILGDTEKNFYADFPNSNIDDYAIVKDFELGIDRINVHSEVTLIDSGIYTSLQGGAITGGVGIRVSKSNSSSGTELIGIIENISIDREADILAAIDIV